MQNALYDCFKGADTLELKTSQIEFESIKYNLNIFSRTSLNEYLYNKDNSTERFYFCPSCRFPHIWLYISELNSLYSSTMLVILNYLSALLYFLWAWLCPNKQHIYSTWN